MGGPCRSDIRGAYRGDMQWDHVTGQELRQELLLPEGRGEGCQWQHGDQGDVPVVLGP